MFINRSQRTYLFVLPAIFSLYINSRNAGDATIIESTPSSRASWDSFNGLKIARNPCFEKGILQLEIKTSVPLLASKKWLFHGLGRENMATAACSFSLGPYFYT